MSDLLIVKRPQVAAMSRKTPVAVVGSTLAAVGLGVFLWLSDARAAQQDRGTALPPLPATTATAPAPLAQSTTIPPPAQPNSFFIPNSGPVTLVAAPPTRQTGFEPAIGPRPVATDPMRERLRAPTLVVDLAQADPQRTPGSVEVRSDAGSGSTSTTVVTPAPDPPAADRNLSDTERFSTRVGNEEVEVARAHRMSGLDRLVPQGAVVAAVMETALNSDLPGYARAVIQRDVRSFDGSAVLIPAGSRVIGQYKSGVAQGASRVFVLWTRLIRPDGVSIELASPATDELGRGGIGGKVNRHFLQRFGGAILTTVLSAGINAAAASRSGGSTIFVGSAGQASSLASQAAGNADIPPTITTRQGAAVRIFVARDLDFSRVGPAR
ncbi:MAG: TrbI/VirB10 family protein [Sphingomonas sp.]|uniref:TrbI/VirB10 family protein n=1 Tax=Sphingomonas sp. TaxID=28214 RepID=UPI00181C872E|nr:TrbI/VirB10 family protein [Sphingomonas sp.]MBA3667808.1 TrbI/VirB10 family protein [Sphingomonas sp.]